MFQAATADVDTTPFVNKILGTDEGADEGAEADEGDGDEGDGDAAGDE
jgi:hypothetical protein